MNSFFNKGRALEASDVVVEQQKSCQITNAFSQRTQWGNFPLVSRTWSNRKEAGSCQTIDVYTGATIV